MDETNALTERIMGRANEVHREFGPGLLESVYEEALCIELEQQGLAYARQLELPATYKGVRIGTYRPDLLIEDAVIVELKTVQRLEPVFQAQILTYLRITGKKVGLFMNFESPTLLSGLRRFTL